MDPKQTLIPTMVLLLAASLCSSCATKAFLEATAENPHYIHTPFTERLWDATSAGNDIVEVPLNEAFEVDLVESGLAYTKNEERGYYYIEGSSGERTKDRILRILGTPVAVAADLCLEGVLLLSMAAGSAI